MTLGILMTVLVMETADLKAGLAMDMQIVKTRLTAVISPVMIMTVVTVVIMEMIAILN